MVQIDIPAAFCVSLFALDVGRSVVKSEVEAAGPARPAIYFRYLCRTVFFAGFVIAPAGIYLLAGWPGWENIYWCRSFEAVMHSGWSQPLLYAGFVMAIVLAAYVGHVLGYWWLVRGREKLIRPTWIAVLVMVCIVVLASYPSFLLVGTYDQYHNEAGQSRDAMKPVWSNPHGFSAAWIGVMVYFVIGFLCLVWCLRRDAKRHRGSIAEERKL